VHCTKVLEKLADFLDETARKDLCRAIEKHLSDCANCRLYVDSVKKTIILYHAQNEADVQDVPRAVSAQLQEALAREYMAARKND